MAGEVPLPKGTLMPPVDYREVPLPQSIPQGNDAPIRIFKLLPSSGDGGDIIGELKVRDKGEDYEAISYYWGKKDDKRPIMVRIGGKYKTHMVTPNLHAALKNLRHHDRDRPLWVDAICINQEDTVEKSAQIILMDKVFRRATNVCVWLGESTPKSQLAWKHIEEMLNFKDFERLIKKEHAEKWAALSELMRRPWFHRRWVVQEIGYARNATIHCGKDTRPWQELADAVAVFVNRSNDIARLFQEGDQFNHRRDYLGNVEAFSAYRLVQLVMKLFRKTDEGQVIEKLMSLETLVTNLAGFKTGLPHDIIYSVLSLASDSRSTTEARRPGTTRYANSAVASRVQSWDSQQNRANTDPSTSLRPGRQPTINGHPSHSTAATSDELFDTVASPRAVSRERGPHINGIDGQVREAMNGSIADIEDHDAEQNSQGLAPPQKASIEVSGTGDVEQDERKVRLGKGVFRMFRELVEGKKFHVDYAQAQFFEVCKDFVDFSIRTSQSINIILRPWAPPLKDIPIENRDEERLPTWICQSMKAPFSERQDGTFGRVNADLLVGLPDSKAVYNAAGRTNVIYPFGRAEFSFGSTETGDHRSLYVPGFKVDVIDEVRATAFDAIIPHEWLEFVDWNDLEEEPPDSFWRTLVADRDAAGVNPPSYYSKACQYAFQQKPEGGSLNVGSLSDSETTKHLMEYLNRLKAVVWQRCMFKTRSDLSSTTKPDEEEQHTMESSHLLPPKRRTLGLAPHGARPGDWICILQGCNVPVVLRKVQKKQVRSRVHNQVNGQAPSRAEPHEKRANEKVVTCEIVGECYLHGMMDGSAYKLRGARVQLQKDKREERQKQGLVPESTEEIDELGDIRFELL